MGKEGKSFEEKKEGKMEKEKIPEWLKGIKEKLIKDDGLYQGVEKIKDLPNSEQLATKEELKELKKAGLFKHKREKVYVDDEFRIENTRYFKELEFEEALQKTFEDRLSMYYESSKAKEVEEYAKEKGIELEIKKGLQKAFENKLARGHTDRAKEIEKYAKAKGVKLEAKKEALQEGVEVELLLSGQAKEMKKYAKAKGVKLEVPKTIESLCKGKEVDYDELAEEIAKMDYSDRLRMLMGILGENGFYQEKEVKIGNASVKSEFYGQIEDNKCKGKFILAKNPKTKEIYFIFDAIGGMQHAGIASVHNKVDAIGGGYLEIDHQNKRVTIKDESRGFGYEPRMISAAVILENFPDYEVSVED